MSDEAERPKRPWELALEEVLSAALVRTGDAERVVVEGRSCLIEFADRYERYLIPRQLVRDAIEFADASELGEDTAALLGGVTVEPWDDEEAAFEIDDGRGWCEGGGGHWCRWPEGCQELRRRQLRERSQRRRR